jgi:putative ABC transport system permease protein
MSLSNAIAVAFEALRRSPMRSALTALGIVIGVAAVIVMMALGGGARESIETRMQTLGTNVITVSAGSMTAGGVRLGQGAVTTLTAADAAAIRTEVPGVLAVSPGLSMRTQILAPGGNWQTQVQGAGDQLPVVRAWTVEIGGFLTEEDVQRAAKVAVLGASVRDQLFGPGTDPTGAIVRIANQPFTVIGVLSRKGQSPMGQDQDDTVIVPYTTMQKRLMGVRHVSAITVAVADGTPVPQASAALTDLLRSRHRLRDDEENDFTVRSFEELASVLTSTTDTMTYLLASVAAVSLLVGGIGIMNIMLVSVTERTREVGLRRSLGARRADILRQFLAEAVTLGLAGGLAGVLLGLGASALVSQAFNWNAAVSVQAVVLSFGFAAGIGTFFGLYPARRAASLNPTDALRYE